MFAFTPATFQSQQRVLRAVTAMMDAPQARARLAGLQGGATLIAAAARRRAPRGPERDERGRPRRAHLADTIGVRTYLAAGPTVMVGVGTDDPVGAMMEFGTAPHIIRPRNAGALWWEGARHPVMLVNHPGTRPKPWLKPAADENAQACVFAVGASVAAAARAAAGRAT